MDIALLLTILLFLFAVFVAIHDEFKGRGDKVAKPTEEQLKYLEAKRIVIEYERKYSYRMHDPIRRL